MPSIKWGSPKFWYEVGWRQFGENSKSETFLTKRVYPPQNQFAIPNPIMNMRYQYYVKAVNQQTEGECLKLTSTGNFISSRINLYDYVY
jgi:hypothetical protein